MAFHVFHVDKSIDVNPPISSLESLYDELAMEGSDVHGVAVQHCKGWMIEARGDGVLVWYDRWCTAKYMIDVPKEEVLKSWRMLAKGQFDAIEKQPWEDDDGFATNLRH